MTSEAYKDGFARGAGAGFIIGVLVMAIYILLTR